MTLEALIQPLGIMKKDLAAAIGARPETVSRWLSEKHTPSGDNMVSLLRFLNRPEHLRKLGRRRPLTLDDLVGGETGRAA